MRSQILNFDSSTPLLTGTGLVPSYAKKDQTLTKPSPTEETLVVDERAFFRPAQAVEEKLSQLLETSCIGVSQLRLKDLLSGRARNG